MAKYTQNELFNIDFKNKKSIYLGNYLYLVKRGNKKIFQVKYTNKRTKKSIKKVIGEFKHNKKDSKRLSIRDAETLAKKIIEFFNENKKNEIDKLLGKEKKESNKNYYFKKLFFEYLNNFRKQKVSSKTIKMEGYYYNNYLKSLENKDVRLIKKFEISKLLKRVQEKSIKNKHNTKTKSGYNGYDTAMRVKTTLNQFYNYLVGNGIVKENPIKDLKLDTILPVKKIKKKKEIETDLKKLQEYYLQIRFYHKNLTGYQKRNFQIASKYLTEFLFLTAMRNKQARLTKWEYIDWKKNVIIYPPQTVKKRREYILPITHRIKTILKTLQKLNKNNSEYVFFNKRSGKNLTDITVSRILKNVTKGKITSHNFRDILLTLIKIYYKHDYNKITIAHQILDHSRFIDEIDDIYTFKNAKELLDMRKEILEWWYNILYYLRRKNDL